VAGTDVAEAVADFTGRSRKVRILLLLALVGLIVGLVPFVPSPGELFESVRFRHYFDDYEEPAWFYLIFTGIFGDLAKAGSRLFWHGNISILAEAREHIRTR
jgi:hypothetical protein